MFMWFRTEQSYGQVQRELKKYWVAAGNTNVLFNSNDSKLKKKPDMRRIPGKET
jgi:hypothetical protein